MVDRNLTTGFMLVHHSGEKEGSGIGTAALRMHALVLYTTGRSTTHIPSASLHNYYIVGHDEYSYYHSMNEGGSIGDQMKDE